MASTATLICFLFCLCLSLSSLHTHARESHFFSKFYPYSTTATTANPSTTTTTTNNNNVKETQLFPSEEDRPTFTPEAHTGYGLYGRSTDQETPLPFSTIPKNTNTNSEYVFNNGVPHTTNQNSNEYAEAYQGNGNGDSNGNFNTYQYPTEQQGMSDTRYLENGKYFYDLNNEEMYKNRYQSVPRRNYGYGSGTGTRVNSRNQYKYESEDENLYRFNNFMDEQEKQEEYVP